MRLECQCGGDWAPVGRTDLMMIDGGVNQVCVFVCTGCRVIRNELASYSSRTLEKQMIEAKDEQIHRPD